MRSAQHCSQILLPALAMSVGWGFRGNYGHEAGAMVPGALVALAVCLTAHRPEWWQRSTLMAFLGAIGWSFGGQMSYGRVIGYTAGMELSDVVYGYASLFLIGALWGGIGAGILALSVTLKRSELERFTVPLVFLWLFWLALDFSGLTSWLFELWNPYDVDWVAAGSAALVSLMLYRARSDFHAPCGLMLRLAIGWLLGFFLLTLVLGLRMTPPRGDNWAGCVGVLLALIYELRQQQNRAALRWCGYGFLFGGLGFLLGDFMNMLGRAQWSIIGAWPVLQGLDYWKWMEQLFGLIMGAGIGWGAQTFARQQTAPKSDQGENGQPIPVIALAAPQEDVESRGMNFIGLIFLLIVLPWKNLHKNVFRWQEAGWVPDEFAGLSGMFWFLIVGILLSVAVGSAICQARRHQLALIPRSNLGRAQWLFLLILWMSLAGDFCGNLPRLESRAVFVVQISFWITGALCTMLVVRTLEMDQILPSDFWPAEDTRWSFKLWTSVGVALAVPLLCGVIGWLTIQSHGEPLPGSHQRFGASERAD